MSGDLGAEVVVHAAKMSLAEYRNVRLILVGNRSELEGLVERIIGDDPRVEIRPSTEVVEMAEPPADALRRKKDSSMRVAVNLVKDGTPVSVQATQVRSWPSPNSC